MKVLKTIIATVALSAAFMTTAHARDSFSIGVNIGTHGHHHGYVDRHTVITHRHAPIYHGYYHAPRVVYYEPSRYRYYDHRGDRYDKHYHRNANRNHYRGHDDRGRSHRHGRH
jgi:hypothetical protein